MYRNTKYPGKQIKKCWRSSFTHLDGLLQILGFGWHRLCACAREASYLLNEPRDTHLQMVDSRHKHAL